MNIILEKGGDFVSDKNCGCGCLGDKTQDKNGTAQIEQKKEK